MRCRYEIVHLITYRFFGIDEKYTWWWMKCTKLVEYEYFWNWLKFEYENSKICIVSIVRAQLCVSDETHVDVVVFVVWVVFVWFVVWHAWFMKLGYIRRRCGMKENILDFGLSPLFLVYLKFLMAQVLELGCKRWIDWK